MRAPLADLPAFFVLTFAALFGLAVGSFLNVCIFRVPRDLSVVRPRSFCPSCEAPVDWYDNIPVLSYLVLRGRCRHCTNPIGISYLLVEITTAVTFVAVVGIYGISLAAAKWIVYESIMIVLFWTDWQERILPDEFTIGGSIVGLVFASFVYVPSLFGELLLGNQGWRIESLANAVAGASFLSLPMWLVASLYEQLRGREGLGFGDVKLLFLMGSFLGPENGLSALTIGATSGALFGIATILRRREDAWTYALPFGSFLALAGYLVPLVARLRLTGIAFPAAR
jgi:leader peptidase (prepilin peptidase) / N-methyltransferase